ncbi:hypothetical protein GGR51DRAFT_214093 [Nemania sp. FL0031]|nr:hypothetical protein GGR51DRAFT_214093 [Nemania sp. FL0031]
MNSNSTMNTTYYNISREGSEMTESPIIPLSLGQTYPRPQKSSSLPVGSREPELNKWKSRVPKTGNSPLVPKPLFSSAKIVVETEPIPTSNEAPVLSSAPNVQGIVPASPTSTAAPTTEVPTPISPSPSLFPIPPSAEGIVVSPVSMMSTGGLHASNSVVSRSSVYSQSTTGNTIAAGRPRPASSVYSQKTLTTIAASGSSSPRTPTMTNWAATLPGLPSSSALYAEAQISISGHQHMHAAVNMEQVAEEQEPATPYIQSQIQVPRLRSPSLPQDRGNRRRTISCATTTSPRMQVNDRRCLSGQQFVQSPEAVSQPEIHTMSVDYEGSNWPLQKPSVVHNIPHKHYVSRSQGSNFTGSEARSSHVANKESISSSFTHTAEHHNPDLASPRVSIADSRTPIYGPGEQRSGWWSDEEDPEQGRRRGNSVYAVIGMGNKASTEAQRRRTRKIRIIAGVSILVLLIIVGVAVGVTVGVQHKSA